MNIRYSIVIPVYKRPQEIRDLLESFQSQVFLPSYEIIVVDDGSVPSCEAVVLAFKKTLPLRYYYKSNTGPGDSRNFGVKKALGTYVIFMDSDCIVPKNYLQELDFFVTEKKPDCFGGRDTIRKDFTNFQKAINHTLTSFLTTGGVRGGKISDKKFQPRSFNMGIRKVAFEKVGGFRNIHPGEDPDLVMNLRKDNYSIFHAKDLMIYHRRRISWKAFAVQMYKFGLARVILNYWHPSSHQLTYWFPLCFSLGLIACVAASPFYIYSLALFSLYFLLIFAQGLFIYKNLSVALYSIPMVITQFFCYGYGFLKAQVKLSSNKNPKEALPFLFFKESKT